MISQTPAELQDVSPDDSERLTDYRPFWKPHEARILRMRRDISYEKRGTQFGDNARPVHCVYGSVRHFAFILFAAQLWAAIADPKTEALLKRVERRYNGNITLTVNFSETYSGPGRAARTETGKLYLLKPGKMRWEYTSPAGKLFISDGKNVYLYLPDSNRVQQLGLKATEDMRAPLAFLLGKLNFEREFQNLQARPDAGGTVITADAKSGNLPYTKVVFVLSPNLEIRKLQVVGQDQSVLDFSFDDERLNPAFSAGLFQFKAPPGVEVVDGAQ
jgi:outer membrane lipoprotein carrier protein